MKTNIFFQFFLFTLLIGFIACSDMADTYREFIEGGETIYIGKADSIKTRGGRERIEVSWYLMSDPKVTGYKLFWNNKRDSVTGSVVKTDQVDTVRVLLENMPEYVYNFEIYLNDNFGNRSIRSSAIGRTYGDFYESSLLNRTYQNIRRLSGTTNIIISWANPSEEMIGVKINYLDIHNNNVQKFIGQQNQDTIKEIRVRGEFSYRTAFIPESNALDTFYSKIQTVTLAN